MGVGSSEVGPVLPVVWGVDEGWTVVGTEDLRSAVGLVEGANVDGTDGVLRDAVGPVEGAIVDGSSVGNGIGGDGASVGLLLSSSSSRFGDGAAVVGSSKILGSAVEGLGVVAPFFR